MGMEQNFNKTTIESKENTGKIAFPHGEEAVRLFEKEYPENLQQIEKAGEIFKTFFEQEMKNITIFKSKEEVDFPYTHINIGELAKELYSKNSKTPLKEKLEENKEKSILKKEFVFESFLTTVNGNPFTFVEEAMHQAVMNLPRALENLKNGIEPEDMEVYTLGSPTNLLGTMTRDFYEGIKKDPFRNLGRIYAELIEEKINKELENKKPKIYVELYGISMGAGIAAMTGEKLLENNEFTQETQPEETEDRKTFLQIKAVLPVTLSRSKIKKIQIPVGFFYDSVKGLISNQYIRKIGPGEPSFIKNVNEQLAKRGIYENNSPEQKEMKSKSMPRLILALGDGLVLKEDTKVDEIYGLRDSTTSTSSLKKDAEMQKKLHPETIGTNIIPRERENSRTFVVNASHLDIPGAIFKEKSELRRIKVAVEKLEALEK
jgi:hypothetical protein